MNDMLSMAKECYIEEAEEFLRERKLLHDEENLRTLSRKWESYVAKNFDRKSPESFYEKWTGEIGASNIAANILDQFSRNYVFAALKMIFAQENTYSGSILDFGCGTAAVSVTWQRLFAPSSTLILADVNNLAREFLQFQQLRYPQYRLRLSSITLNEIPDSAVDIVLCIDVLEHLRFPSNTFKTIAKKIKPAGYLIIQAPWLGHPEHLEEAPIDWENGGGKSLLEEKFLRIAQMNPAVCLSGIYVKRL